MFSGWLINTVLLTYAATLFALAYWGDKTRLGQRLARSPISYSLSLAIFCSSWAYFGVHSYAVSHGWGYLALFAGPVLVYLLSWRLLEKMALVSRVHNLTSLADFIAYRYGRPTWLGALITCLAVIAVAPYMGLQFEALSSGVDILTAAGETENIIDPLLLIALLLAAFSMLFGTRHLESSRQHSGLVLAICLQSLLKIGGMLAGAAFLTWGFYDGPGELLGRMTGAIARTQSLEAPLTGSFLTACLLSALAVISLPRQFHVTVTENIHSNQLQVARWLFPGLMIVMMLALAPSAFVSIELHQTGSTVSDTLLLELTRRESQTWLTPLLAIGGLTAATAMLIVAGITLATMLSNDILLPLYLRLTPEHKHTRQPDRLLVMLRRSCILLLMLCAYFSHQLLDLQLSLIEATLVIFAGAVQFIPALIGGLYWRNGTLYGATAGLISGSAVWLYTLFIPMLQGYAEIPTVSTLLPGHPVLDPIAHGTLWSLSLNTVLYILVSRFWPASAREISHAANRYIDIKADSLPIPDTHQISISVGQLQRITERFMGMARAQEAFTDFARRNQLEQPLADDIASPEQIEFTERLLAGVIGASSARIVLSSVLHDQHQGLGELVSIVDEASQALRFNRSLLQSTLENITQGISVVDQQLRLVAWNRRYLELFDYPDGLVCIGRPIEEVLRFNALKGEYGSGDIDRQVRQRMDSIRRGDNLCYERFRPDGTVLEVRGNRMPNGGYVHTYMDITNHKRTEEALRESEQNIRIYTDNVPVLIAYLDPERRYLFVNKAYSETFGIDRYKVSGRLISSLLSEHEYLQRAPYIEDVLRGEHQKFEVRLPAADNAVRYGEATYIPHIGRYGDVLGYFTLYQDITERRKAEIALQETNENLEQRVSERTQELSVINEALLQAKAQAEEANLGKTRYLAAASHDLLQPLNAARLFVSALAQQNHSDQQTQNLVTNLDGSLKAAEQLITTILDISKLDAGALEPNISHFSLEPVLKNLGAEFAAMAKEKGLELHWVKTRAVVCSDQALLRRIVQNLVSNAIRYTHQGKILLGARRHGDQLRIEVWDTGVGIPEQKIGEIFEEFKRIDNPKHSQVKGLGLGLAITERIAKMLNHTLHVRSWPGKGSVFSVTLPLGQASQAQTNTPEKRGWIRSKGLKGLRVLIIDNEPKILEGMQALLGGWECEILTALSAEIAEQKVHEHDFIPDIILADYHLSETHTGIMALRQLQPLWPTDIPSVVITADRTDEVKEEIEGYGAYLLTKPLKPAALRAMLNKLYSRNTSGSGH